MKKENTTRLVSDKAILDGKSKILPIDTRVRIKLDKPRSVCNRRIVNGQQLFIKITNLNELVLIKSYHILYQVDNDNHTVYPFNKLQIVKSRFLSFYLG